MNHLYEYAIQSPYFIAGDWHIHNSRKEPPKLVAVDDVNEPEFVYCCEAMRALCSEIDGFYYNTPNVEEFEQMRQSEYYDALCRERNAHVCEVNNAVDPR